jgi:hypothetical protein
VKYLPYFLAVILKCFCYKKSAYTLCWRADCRDLVADFRRSELAWPAMEARAFPNPFPDWPADQPFSLDSDRRKRIVAARDNLLHCLEHPAKFAEYLAIRETLHCAEDDPSVYTGEAVSCVSLFY